MENENTKILYSSFVQRSKKLAQEIGILAELVNQMGDYSEEVRDARKALVTAKAWLIAMLEKDDDLWSLLEKPEVYHEADWWSGITVEQKLGKLIEDCGAVMKALDRLEGESLELDECQAKKMYRNTTRAYILVHEAKMWLSMDLKKFIEHANPLD
jgi:hypothetical protein